ncbi:MAG: excisionase family DNA-binding protein [Chloroflexi bacterium]|nr:excisionase family DNA-binding protein [Chloroflexota bacterium]
MTLANRTRTVDEELRTALDDVRAIDPALGNRVATLIEERERSRDTEYLTSTEAAEALGVSRNTVKKWARLGYLHDAYRTDGGHVRIPRHEVDRVARLERLMAETPEPIGPAPEADETAALPWRS